MAATNVYQNVSGLVVGGQSITSVLEIRVDDNTQTIQDGSDNDDSFTFSQRQGFQCRVSIRVRDAVECEKMAGRENVSMTWVENAATGYNKTGTVSNCSFGQSSPSGSWQNLREYVMNGIGGRFTMS